jgi:hypothetical protein
MICRFEARWYQNGELDNHYMESGYVAGETSTDCYRKVHDWYFSDDSSAEMDSILISVIPAPSCEDDILITNSVCPENIIATYDPEPGSYDSNDYVEHYED